MDDYVIVEESDLLKEGFCNIIPSDISSRLKTIVKGIYNTTMLIGDISHVYGVIYFIFHLYRNPATYAAISTIGHGHFLVFYVTFLKLRGWL